MEWIANNKFSLLNLRHSETVKYNSFFLLKYRVFLIGRESKRSLNLPTLLFFHFLQV